MGLCTCQLKIPPPHPGEVWGIDGGYQGFWHIFVSEGVGDLLLFVASVLPVGWGVSKVLTFVDERGLRRMSRVHVVSHPQRWFQNGRH